MNCECDYCRNHLSFDLSEEIIDASISGNLVIFAGAGISTENRIVFKETLFEDIYSDLEIKDSNIDFPTLLSLFCKQKNGRRKLLEKIRNRFEYCHQFNEIYRAASRFHNELSSIYSIEEIVTTNWDDFFEKECNAIPMVTAEDFAFYNLPDRKVFKIHGSISNYGSIIATTEDYKKCYKNLSEGIIGGALKTMLATKTIVFIGYSFNDFDFNKIYNYLKKELKDIIPHCYIVTLDEGFQKKYENEKVTVIKTDGVFFIESIRKHLEGINFLIPKSNIEIVKDFIYLRGMHHEISVAHFAENKTTTNIFNLFYQDGLQHAFDYLIYNSRSGKSFNPWLINNSIESYEEIKKELLKAKNYSDYAYVAGYIVGLHSIFYNDNTKAFPFYFIMGIGPIEEDKDFFTYTKKQSSYHKTADKLGKIHFKNVLSLDSSVVPHHKAFIF